jgi:uncharacterized membrane protein
VFALWLFYTSFVVIGALCPWCLLVTLTTILVWFSITRYNIREKNLYLPAKVQKQFDTVVAKDFDKLAMAILVVGLVAAILIKYGSQLFS